MDPLSSFRARGNRNKDDVNASTPHSESHSARSAVVAEEDPRSAETPLSKDILGRNTSHSEKENPFAMPSDDEVFALRDEERRKKKESREQSRNLHVWEKPTWSSKMGTTRLFQEGEEPEDGEGDEKKGEAGGHGDRRREKENLNDFIAKKREMFLVQMSLDTKRDEMRKLEERARQREEALKKSEQMLEEDAMRFDAFLKENDMKAVEAIKRAENESKLKLEKVQEIKKLNAQIMAIKSDMSKDEEQLEECRRYKEFLDSLTPPEWLAEQQTLKQKRIQEKKAKKAAEKAKGNTANADGKAVAPKKDVKKDATSSTTKSGGTNDGDESEDDDDVGISLILLLIFSPSSQLLYLGNDSISLKKKAKKQSSLLDTICPSQYNHTLNVLNCNYLHIYSFKMNFEHMRVVQVFFIYYYYDCFLILVLPISKLGHSDVLYKPTTTS
eukprot:TRINITY_DN188_c0_g1_i3.p1 TRINITY_DN188_c0_g1~~TRINITY_DN188_c0_g1_i3.p1  ORF type:complete len:442 (+),score=99.10 TRINITY_DN188_c0_g1_i3:66-1391(+)